MERPCATGPILFLHVPKTAGTATARLFESVYPGELFYDYGTERDRVSARTPDPAFLRNQNSIVRHYGMIFGHYHYLKYASLFPEAPVVALVRDPLERAISHYYHAARYQDPEPLPQAGKVRSGEWDVVDFTRLSGLSKDIYSDYFEGLAPEDFATILIQEELAASLARMARTLQLSKLAERMTASGGIPLVNERPAAELPPHVHEVTPAQRAELASLLGDDIEIYRQALAIHRRQIHDFLGGCPGRRRTPFDLPFLPQDEMSTGIQELDKYVTPYETISHNYKTNRYKRWLSTGEGDPYSAQERFGNDFFHVGSKPKFKLNPASKVFTIGSCFARNIERQLDSAGVCSLTRNPRIPAEYYTSDRDASSSMNKFNIPSMIDEIARTFDQNFREEGRYFEVGDGIFFDPATSGLKLLPLDKLLEVRERIKEVTGRIAQADAVIITLGLVEMWRDKLSGLFFNTSPHPLVMRQYRERLQHLRPGFDFLRSQLFELIDHIRVVAPEAKMILSVSPVPLQATMTADDVVASSTLSKCLLRACAEAAREHYDHVDYFPSYEMVMHSPRALTWLEDTVHVNPDQVANVTRSFMREWFTGFENL